MNKYLFIIIINYFPDNNNNVLYNYYYFASQKKNIIQDKNYGWFESHANGFPSTNNCLKATNGVIKQNTYMYLIQSCNCRCF